MGIVPVWGYQMLIAAFLAHIFKLNKVITLLASNISIPPMMPLILFGSYWMGSMLVGTNHSIRFVAIPDFATLSQSLVQYLVGSVCLAVISAAAFGLLSFLSLQLFRKNAIS